jgi:ubiquitin C-terminal hydrolase
MAPEAQLEEIKNSYLTYVEQEEEAPESQNAVEISSCFNNMFKQSVVESVDMAKSCVGCGKKQGLQKQVEISKLSHYIGVQIDKANPR